MSQRVSVTQLRRCPVRPELITVRAALASIFNIDATADTEVSPGQAVGVLAYKLLCDIGLEPMLAVDILRRFRNPIEQWEFLGPAILSINDNRYALLVGGPLVEGFDFKACVDVDPTKLPAPILQASVNLTRLSELIE